MKRASLILLLAALIVLASAGAAYAQGGIVPNYKAWTDPIVTTANNLAGQPNPGTPHKGYTTTTIKCAVCHSVHDAAAGGELLLRSTVADACSYCHITSATGVIDIYAPLGNAPATLALNDNLYTQPSNFAHDSAGGATCTGCHSVHGSNTIDGALGDKILKASNAYQAVTDKNFDSTAPFGVSNAAGVSTMASHDEQETLWCTSCHAAYATSSDQLISGNMKTHPLKGVPSSGNTVPHATTTAQVAWTAASSCRDCHDAGDTNATAGVHDQSFPHSTPSNAKFLVAAAFTGDTAVNVTNASQDGVCLKCHRGSATTGIGLNDATFNDGSGKHTAGANCASCHAAEFNLWASSANLHSASAGDILTNSAHNTAELLTDSCLKCHSSFQYPSGVASMVTPIDQTGPWNLTSGASAWQATKCEVCHDPSATNTAKLAKYGANLDDTWAAAYIPVSSLDAPHTQSFSGGVYADHTITAGAASVKIDATKVCLSCHDPADQGGDPALAAPLDVYGTQGGDSRSFVTANHADFGCADCHKTHDFTPIADPRTDTACNIAGCHVSTGPATLGGVGDPGKVHTNHL